MHDSAREFFEGVETEAPRAKGLTASYRFEIAGAGTWRVEIRDGSVTVAESEERADCVISTDEQTFLGVVQNEQSPMGAFLAGRIRVEGDMGLALRLRDVFG
ncbi:MAG TPA: SCP2 sterol-binding domain-containing protein [Gaiellaceae bacterium]|nr:SCP2 sterol-binding domain-containing protein [Gaiellaceae bacterium]